MYYVTSLKRPPLPREIQLLPGRDDRTPASGDLFLILAIRMKCGQMMEKEVVKKTDLGHILYINKQTENSI